MTNTDIPPDLVDTLRELAREYDDATVLRAAVRLFGPNDVVEVYARDDGQWGWRVKAANHEGIATPGEGYDDAYGAERAARRATFRDPIRA